MLLLILKLLLILPLLIGIGEPLRFLLFKRFKFSNLDPIEVCMLDVYVGGLILYVVAVLPFKLFNSTVILGFTVLSILLSFIIHVETLKETANLLKVKNFVTRVNRKTFSIYVLVFVMFTMFLVINLFSVTNFVFGSVRDESVHSLYVQVILENGHIPLTLQPYLREGIIYPQAAHVIFAFSSYFLSMEVPHVVLYVTILFKALSVVAAFSLGLKLGFDRSYSAVLSFVFAFISSWPLFITWGGNPFAVGFPLFLVCLGLFSSLLKSNRRHSYAELLTLGLLFGYLGAIVTSYLQVLMVIAFFVLIYYVVRKRKVSRLIREFVALFCVSLLPLSPFLYRFFSFYQYPGHNIGVASDFMGWESQQLGMMQAFQWVFDNLSPYLLLRALIFLYLAALAVLVWRTRDYGDVKRVVAFASIVLVSATTLSFLSFLLPADFGVVSWGHQGIIMSISINLLIFAFYVKATKIIGNWLKNHLPHIVFNKRLHTSSILTFVLLSLITAPFLYYRFAVDHASLQGAYSLYGITTVDDYNLMLWMRENLSLNAVILVHPYEAGLFIPSVSHHKIVFPYSSSTLSRRYQTVVQLMENKTMNVTTYELMQDLGVSHVFVGAQVAWCEGYSIWVPELFLGNPNFKLVKNFGMAYLFELNYTDPNVVFWDDFEYEVWNRNLWRVFSVGQGLGNVSIAEAYGYNGSKCLKIASEMQPTVLDWYYAYGVSREIFVSNASEVRLSFYLNATQGFSRKDTFAVLISNVYRNQSLVVATTNPYGVYENYVGAVVLNGAEGFFEFKGNQSLSALWQERFNSTLPNQFILEFVSWDLDGIENIAYIDNVQITLIPLSAQKEVG